MESDGHDKGSNNSKPKWIFQCGSQNLSGALNDPNIGRQIHFFKHDWGEAFSDRPCTIKPTYFPEITRRDFDEYTSEFSKAFILHAMAKDTFKAEKFSPDILQNFPTLRSIRPPTDLGQGDIGKISEIFFDPNFNLRKKNIFEQVFVGSQSFEPEESVDAQYNAVVRGSQSTVRLLQAKLFHYLDIVEIQIANQVKQKSGNFFDCIASHEDLTDRLAKTKKLVQTARQEVDRIRKALLENSYNVLRLKIRQRNYVQLYQKLKLVAVVTKTTCVIQHLLSCSDYMTAVDTVAILRDMLNNELYLVKCLRFQRSQISEIENIIDRRLDEEFELYLTESLNRPWSNCREEICDDDQLVKIIFGILRRKHFHSFDEFKRILLRKVKEVVQVVENDMAKCLDSKITCTNSNNEHLSQLSLADWMEFFKTLTGNLITLINIIKEDKNIIHGVVVSCVEPTEKELDLEDQQKPLGSNATRLEGRLLTDEAITTITSKLNDTMASICDFAGQLVSKFINSYWLVDKAAASEFCDLGQRVDTFKDVCKSVCGRSSTSLDVALTSQSDKFVHNFHKERKEQLKLILNSECWKCVDVPKEFQEFLDEIVRSGNLQVLKLNAVTSEPSRFLLVNNEPYKVAGVSLILLKMTAEYCACASELPVMASTVYRCLTELVQFFNARSCELLLGTTALYTAGLKTITVSNLAIAARGLQLVAFLLPFLRQHFQNIVETNNKTGPRVKELKDFDLVKGAIEEHIEEIQSKITSITGTIINKQLAQWYCTLPVPSQSFISTIKQLRKLHDAVGDILTLAQIHGIYRDIHEEFSRNLEEQLNRMELPSREERRETVRLEVKFYADALEDLGVLSNSEIYGPLNSLCSIYDSNITE